MGSSSLEHDEVAAVVDTGLVLGLGPSGATTGSLSPVKPRPLAYNSHSVEPSLTLGRQATIVEENWEVKRSPSSPQSMASSLSNGAFPSKVKRERDVVGDDERISSRASDEDDDGSAKKKLRLTKDQSALLEERFKEHSTLNPKQKIALAHQLKLRPRQVEVWFQNRRARTKLKQTEVDCEFLKRCCESLTEENRRLQKEVQQLRALKHVPTPLFMQIPAVTMCPSCERTTKTTTTTNGSNPDPTKDSNNVDPFMVSNKSHFYNHFTHSSSAAC